MIRRVLAFAAGLLLTASTALAQQGQPFGISYGTGIATFLGTPSSANLAAAVTGETGTGKLVFDISPIFDGPVQFGTTSASRKSTFDAGGRLTTIYTDNSVATVFTFQNNGITAAGQGLRIDLGLAQSGTPGATTGGFIDILADGDYSTGAASDSKLVLGVAINNVGSTAATLDQNGLTLVGALTSTTATLNAVASDAATTNNTACIQTTTGLVLKGSGLAGICLGTSSLRFKHDVAPSHAGLPEIMGLRLIEFRYNKGYGDDGTRLMYGFAAEDVAKSIPRLVGVDAAGLPATVDHVGMVPLLVGSVQQQQGQIDRQGLYILLLALWCGSLSFAVIVLFARGRRA